MSDGRFIVASVLLCGEFQHFNQVETRDALTEIETIYSNVMPELGKFII